MGKELLQFRVPIPAWEPPNIMVGAHLPKWRLLQGRVRDHRILWSYPLRFIHLQFGYFIASFLLLLLMAFVVFPSLQA